MRPSESDPCQNPSQHSPAALPVALPPASSTEALSAQVSAEFGASRETNTSLISVARSSSTRRVGSARLRKLASELSDRDQLILRLLLGHRFLTSQQVEGFCFSGHASALSGSRSARRVLRRLHRDGLIAALTRRIGGIRAGSSGFVWQLAPAGMRLVHGRSGFRTSEPSVRFLDHCLAVADAHLTARQLERAGRLGDLNVETEPECWRTFASVGGVARWLKPDLFLRAINGDYEDRWFVEVDRGTESLSTVLGKCTVYEAYRESGTEQARHGAFPLVIWQLPDVERQHRLERAIGRTLHLTPRLYRCVTPDRFGDVIVGGDS